MAREFVSLSALMIVWGFSVQAQAALVLLGTDTLGNKLIYDSDLDVTWYDHSNPTDGWLNQWSWADALSVTFGSTTYNEWRLPTALNQDGSGTCVAWGVDNSGCTGSEMGHLYYAELGNQAGGPFSNTGPFQNLIGARYWSWPVYAPDPFVNAWDFRFLNGKQEVWNQANLGYALAVHPGLIVPVRPATPVPVFPLWGRLAVAAAMSAASVWSFRRQSQR